MNTLTASAQSIQNPFQVSNRIQPTQFSDNPFQFRDCTLDLRGLDFGRSLRVVREAVRDMEKNTQSEVKATFYFEEETKVEMPWHLKQLRAEWVTKMTLKMNCATNHLFLRKLSSKWAGRSLYDFPLDRVVRLELTQLTKSNSTQELFMRLWKRKHPLVWTHLEAETILKYIPTFETLSLTDKLSEDDLLYVEGCFELGDAFEFKCQDGKTTLRLMGGYESDGFYRAWVTRYDTRKKRSRHYLWLTPHEALFYQDEWH